MPAARGHDDEHQSVFPPRHLGAKVGGGSPFGLGDIEQFIGLGRGSDFGVVLARQNFRVTFRRRARPDRSFLSPRTIARRIPWPPSWRARQNGVTARKCVLLYAGEHRGRTRPSSRQQLSFHPLTSLAIVQPLPSRYILCTSAA